MALAKQQNERVRRRINTNSQNLADGLERFQEDLLDMFNSQLERFRSESLARDEERLAMLSSLVLEIGALKEGIAGLSQQFSDVLAALEAERV